MLNGAEGLLGVPGFRTQVTGCVLEPGSTENFRKNRARKRNSKVFRFVRGATISELKPAYFPESLDRLILNGFYPRIYDQSLDPTQAMGDYFETYVERNLRQLISLKDKAGATINPDFFKGLRNFQKTVGDQQRVFSGILYGGNEVQQRSGVLIHPAVMCEELFNQFEKLAAE